MNQNDCSGKTLNPWPVLLDHHMVGNFKAMKHNAYSATHTMVFFSKEKEYELNLQSLSEFNLIDSSVIFPEDYIFSKSGCWEISFDLIENMINRTHFAPPEKEMVNPIAVMRAVERAIFDHYNEYKVGMYVFFPDNDKLEHVYRRLIERRLGNGFTLELGLGPDRREYVIRTPKCY